MAYAPEAFHNFWIELTISATRTMGPLFGLTVTSDANIITVNGFAMRIIPECTAIQYILILSSAILLYTRHPLTYRLAGLGVSTAFILTVNAIRLLIIGVIGSISYDAFVIVHDYLWVAVFSLIILGVWIIWAERRFALSRRNLLQVGLVLLICTTTYGLLLMAMPFYGALLAKVTSPLFRTLLSDPLASVMFNGKLMVYRHTGNSFGSNFSDDIMVVAIFIGLFLSTKCRGNLSFKGEMGGIAIIFIVNVATITGGGVFNVTSGRDCAIFQWTAHCVLLLLGLLWWILRSSDLQGVKVR